MNVSDGHYIPSLRPPVKNTPDWYLKKNLLAELEKEKKFILELREDLPFADLAIKRDKHDFGMILTDDDLFYQSISSKEAHVYNPFTLSMKNWKFRGVFSREYWQDKDRVIERMVLFSNHVEE